MPWRRTEHKGKGKITEAHCRLTVDPTECGMDWGASDWEVVIALLLKRSMKGTIRGIRRWRSKTSSLTTVTRCTLFDMANETDVVSLDWFSLVYVY